MGKTPDRFPGTREEDEIQLVPGDSDPSENGGMVYRSSIGFKFLEEGVLRSFRVQDLGSGSEDQGLTVQTNGSGGIQLAPVVSGYPPAFATILSDVVATTTLDTWSEKVSITTPDLELGAYILFAQAIMSGSKSNSQFEVRAQYDNTDTFGTLNAIAGISFSEFQFFTHTIKENISGIHTIDLDYRMLSGSGYISIRGARLTYWRVSGS